MDEEPLLSFARNISYIEIAQKQNGYSSTTSGFIFVLCTCVMFVSDYNTKLLFE